MEEPTQATTTTTTMATDTLYNDLKQVVFRNFINDEWLHALVITNCNGDKPVPFSKAYVSYKISNQNYPTLAFFGSGIVKIAQAMKGQNAFKEDGTFDNLKQTVFKETMHLECLKSLLDSGSKSEASIRNTLAVHYFQPLAFGSQCVIEKGSLNICEHCKKMLHVGDTSLGHSSVWHGRADIVIKSSVIKVTRDPEKKEDEDDVDDLASGEQTKIDPSLSSIIEMADNCWSLKQALAQAIVNGFCEGNKEPSLLKKFIPSFLATEQTITIIWYNVEWDILLLSEKMSVWSNDSTTRETAKLNIDTLLHVWLALNFDNYDMDVKEEILQKSTHSNFKTVVGEDAYSVYSKYVAKPFVSFKTNFGPEKVAPKPTDDSSFLFAKVKEYYFQETKNILT